MVLSDMAEKRSMFTQKRATEHGLTGWVKNIPNEKVSLSRGGILEGGCCDLGVY